MAVPAPVTPSKQKTIPQYFVKKDARGGPREVKQTPPREFHWPEEHDFTTTDTPPSEFETPGDQRPETVGEGSADKADTEPTWPRGATSDILAKINTYRFVRVGDPEERQPHEMSTEQKTMACTVRNEGKSDNQGISEQPRDVPRSQEGTAEFDWRVDLRDHSFRYDSLVEHGGHTGQHGEVKLSHATWEVGLRTTGPHQARGRERALRGGDGSTAPSRIKTSGTGRRYSVTPRGGRRRWGHTKR